MSRATLLALLAVLGPVSCHTEGRAPVGRRSEPLDEVALADGDLPDGAEVVIGTVTHGDGPIDDLDRDGFTVDADPDDENPFTYPGADEIRCNGVDEDGDGTDLCPPDVDGDGFAVDLDCDDLDASRNPWAVEVGCDDRDQNCDGYDSCDRDGDGVDAVFDLDPNDPTRTTLEDEREPEPID